MLNFAGRLLWPATAVITALFTGRVAAEGLTAAGVTLGWPGTLLLTAVILALALLLFRNRPLRHLWPLLLLTPYLLHPYADLRVAAANAAWAGLTLLFSSPKRRPHAGQWTALGLAALAYLFYRQTLATGVLPADSGEFQLVAANLGVAHPPGFPLYTLLAHAFTRLPFGPDPAWRVNHFSAVIAVATLLLVFALIRRHDRCLVAATLAAATLGVATTFWAQATTANIRALTAFFTALVLYTLFRWHEERAEKWLLATVAALAFGLFHHPSLIFLAAVVAVDILAHEPALLRQPRRWLKPALVTAAAALPTLYLPWRAAAGARGAAGLDTWAGFRDHLLARGFQGDFFALADPAVLVERFRVMATVFSFQWDPLLLTAVGLGIVVAIIYLPRRAGVLGAFLLLHTLVTAVYRAPQTVEYMLPAYVAAALLFGLGLSALRGRGWLAPLLAGVAVIVAGQLAALWPSYASLAQANLTEATAVHLLDAIPPDGVILAHWHWATPLWYLQEVDGRRPDVAIKYVFPTSEPYEQTWARRLAEELDAGHDVLTTHFSPALAAAGPVPEPVGDAFLFRQTPRTTLPDDFTPLDIQLGPRMHLRGLHIDRTAVAVGEIAAVTVAWELTGAPGGPLNLSAVLLDDRNVAVAQDDVPALPAAQLTLTRLRLAPIGLLGDWRLVIGVRDEEDRYDTGDQEVVGTLAVSPSRWRPVTQNPVWRPNVADDRVIIGYDWDRTFPGVQRLHLHWRVSGGYVTEVREVIGERMTEWPPSFGPWGRQRYFGFRIDHDATYIPLANGLVYVGTETPERPLTPGESLTAAPRFASDRPQTDDLVVSYRLIGFEDDDFHWAWTDLHDGVPALGAIPTLKWVAGTAVRDPHPVRVADSATPGQSIRAAIQLYDAFTGRSLPVLDPLVTGRPLPLIPVFYPPVEANR